MVVRNALVLGIFPFLCLVGCQKGTPSLADQMDPASTARLNSLGEDQMVVLSCRVTEMPDPPPDLGRDSKQLASTDKAVLLQIPKSEMGKVAKLSGLESVTVWGDAEILQKLDPRLRRDLLNAIGEPSTEDMGLMVRLKEETPGIEEKLTACGCRTRTVAGRVVTVDASPSAVLCALQIPELAAISAPRPLSPQGG
jgi:hypothetical protein